MITNQRPQEITTTRQKERNTVAVLILLDQSPRHMFRNDPKSFRTDSKALQIASAMVDRGGDKGLSKEEQFFIYRPFEHIEDIAMQDQYLKLTASILKGKAENSPYLWAKQRYDVIARFGRPPHSKKIWAHQHGRRRGLPHLAGRRLLEYSELIT